MQESGPDHDKKFVIEVTVNSEVWGKGAGKSKGEAEQEAARQVLAKKIQ
jgi:ribonuclease-3